MKTSLKLGPQRLEIEFDEHAACKDYYTIVRALIDAQNRKDNASYGENVVRLMRLVMGDWNTGAVFDFYKDDRTKMLNEMVVFLGWRIAPVMKRASRENKNRLLKWWHDEAHRKAEKKYLLQKS